MALPAWWRPASLALSSAEPSPSAAICRRAGRLEVRSLLPSLSSRGYALVDHLFGPSVASSMRDAIREMDEAGELKAGRIQHGLEQSSEASSRSDRIAFVKVASASHAPPQS